MVYCRYTTLTCELTTVTNPNCAATEASSLDNSLLIPILYPAKRNVSAGTLIGWAQDHLTDASESNPALDLEEAIRILDDAGLVTFARSDVAHRALNS